MGGWGNGYIWLETTEGMIIIKQVGGGANNYIHSFWCSKFGCFWRCIWRLLVTWNTANLAYLNLFVKPKEGLFLISPLLWLVIPFPFCLSNFLPCPMGIVFLIPYSVYSYYLFIVVIFVVVPSPFTASTGKKKGIISVYKCMYCICLLFFCTSK